MTILLTYGLAVLRQYWKRHRHAFEVLETRRVTRPKMNRAAAALTRLDALVKTVYACAMSTPRNFDALTRLDEYLPRPL